MLTPVNQNDKANALYSWQMPDEDYANQKTLVTGLELYSDITESSTKSEHRIHRMMNICDKKKNRTR